MGPKESAPRNLIMVPTSKLQELGVVSDVTHCAQLWNLWDPRTDSSRVAGAAESPKPTQPKPTQPKAEQSGAADAASSRVERVRKMQDDD